MSGSGVHNGSAQFDQRRAELPAENCFDLARGGLHDRFFGFRFRPVNHRFPHNAKPHPGKRSDVAGPPGVIRIRRLEHRRARHRGIRIARIVVSVLGILQGIENLGAVADCAAMNAAAVAIDVGADRAPVEAQHRLVRQDQRDGVMVGRAAAGGAGFLAQARHDQIGAHRERGA